MKKLKDGTTVLTRTWYYLLDWNDRNDFVYMNETFNVLGLHQLDFNQYKQLFVYATMQDSLNLIQ